MFTGGKLKTIWLIGESTLLTHVADRVKERGLEVAGVISSHPQVKTWADNNIVACLDPKEVINWSEKKPGSHFAFSNNCFYGLFSISNPHRLNEEFLEHFEYAWNFHNGGRKRRGFHSTFWTVLEYDEQQTLLHDESIMIHQMDQGVDSGPIAVERKVEIRPQDTTLYYEMRCYEAAIVAFEELIDQIRTGNIVAQHQHSLGENYFKHSRPSGFLGFEKSKIDRLVKACDFGGRSNGVIAPKLKIGKHLYLVKHIQFIEGGDKKIGSLVSWDEDVIRIAIDDGAVEYGKFIDLEAGHKISIKDLRIKHQLQKGYIFAEFNDTKDEALSGFISQVAKREDYWVEALTPSIIKSFDFLPQQSSNSLGVDRLGELDLNYFADRCSTQMPSLQFDVIFIAILQIFFYRINNYFPSMIRLLVGKNQKLDQYQDLLQDNKGLISQFLPLSTGDFNPEMSIMDTILIVAGQLDDCVGSMSFLNEIFERYPQLDRRAFSHAVSLQYAQDIYQVQPDPHSPLSIVISPRYKRVRFYIQRNLLHSSAVALVENFIKNGFSHISDLVFASPVAALNKLCMLDRSQQERALQIHTNKYSNVPVHKSFERMAQYFPRAVAIEFANTEYTYAQLNQEVNYLAHWLYAQKDKVKHNIVAICFERSVEMVVTMLAILKAGLAYMPININYPLKHKAQLLEDSNVSLLITSDQQYYALTQNQSQNDLEVHAYGAINVDKGHGHNLNITCTEYDLAYVLYTSGSTGTPKGVMISHGGLSNRIYWMQYQYNLMPSDVVFQKTAYSFDVSVWEFFWPLAIGAKMVLASETGVTDPNYLVHAIDQFGITVMHMVPSMMNVFLQSIEQGNGHSLRLFISSGEALTSNLTRHFQNKLPHVHLYNLYGPTEATIDVTYFNCRDPQLGEAIPIGKMVDNMAGYVLDKYRNLMPPGAIGEFALSGPQVALGYHQRPDLTHKRFKSNPFARGRHHFEKFYLTGDLVRLLPDGNIDFLGRGDQQLKIRGMRVEIGAIESCMVECRYVSDAVVVSRKNNIEQIELVAYVVTLGAGEDDIPKIKSYLEEALPEHMIPSYIKVLDQLPTNQSGKVDIKALPAIDTDRRQVKTHYIAAQNALHQKLISIWQQVLQVDRIGILDDFFALGGDSLAVSEVMLRIKKTMGIALPMYQLFMSPTIAYLTELIEDASIKSKDNQAIASFIQDSHVRADFKKVKILEKAKTVKNIFLTGVTGFIGAYILQQLTQEEDVVVYCLVRGASAKECRTRILKNLLQYNIFVDPHKFVAIPGDLTETMLGLAPQAFEELSRLIDVIYHNGALVHHLYNYQALKSSNVDGTRAVIDLAMLHKLKPVHFISTISAVASYDAQGRLAESFPQAQPERLLKNGYGQTKWTAERLLSQAKEQGLEVSIYRLGWITGESQKGYFPRRPDHNLQLIKGCIQLGYAPSWSTEVYMTPVDVAAKMIVEFSKYTTNEVFNIISDSSMKWRDLISWVNENYYPVNMIAPSLWHDRYLVQLNRHNAIFSLLPLYLHNEDINHMLTQKEIDHLATDKSKALAKKLGIGHVPLNERLLDRYFSYLQKQAFLSSLSRVV